MRYRENTKNGDKISQISFGCMRFPRKGIGIDMIKSAELIEQAIQGGVNYLDTAYIYPGNEVAVGTILAEGLREKVKLATKMPLFLVRGPQDFDKYFAQQQVRLKTNYIDYYLMHMLTDLESFQRLQRFKVEEWIAKEKAKGTIRNIGFSFHGKRESFRQLADAYPWDFCMIQYNYLDEDYQAGTAGLEYAYAKGLPVIVMEPLRGGTLATNLPEEAMEAFSLADAGVKSPKKTNRSPAEWGLRWVLDHPQVLTVLSGMNRADHLKENLRIGREMEAGTLTAAEHQAYQKAVAALRAKIKVNCTGCGYCMPCPANVDIPMCFSRYNDASMGSRMAATVSHMLESGVLPAKSRFASQCKACGKCESHCPQEIEIIKELRAAAGYLEPFWIKPAAKIAKHFTVGKQK